MTVERLNPGNLLLFEI